MALGDVGPTRLGPDERPNPGNLRYGLFNVAPPQTITASAEDPNRADHAYGGGLLYDPIGCGTAHRYEIDCPPTATKTFDPNSPEIPVLPFAVYATLVCGPFGESVQYMTDKTGERLYCSEQHAAEAAFWLGDVGNSPFIADAAGPYGAPVDVSGGLSFATITDAVAALETHAYSTVPYGYNAVLHATPAVAAYAADAFLLQTAQTGYGAVWGAKPDEPILRTPLGSKWVFGGGYPGTGPAAAAPGAGHTFIWITGNVTVWRQPEWTAPPREVMDYAHNQWRILTERGYLATFDCFHAYAKVAIPKAAA